MRQPLRWRPTESCFLPNKRLNVSTVYFLIFFPTSLEPGQFLLSLLQSQDLSPSSYNICLNLLVSSSQPQIASLGSSWQLQKKKPVVKNTARARHQCNRVLNTILFENQFFHKITVKQNFIESLKYLHQLKHITT